MPFSRRRERGRKICYFDIHAVAWARFTDSRGRVMWERMSAILEGQEGQHG
jgi:hypothetical protein